MLLTRSIRTGGLAIYTVPPNLTLQNHEFFPHSVISVHVSFVGFSKAKAIIYVRNISRVVFVMASRHVFCARAILTYY